MNTLIAQEHPVSPTDELRARALPSGIVERLTFRVAFALLRWSTRPARQPLTSLQRQSVRDRETRELAWQCRRLHDSTL